MPTLSTLKSFHFSSRRLLLFALAFGLVGGYILLRTFASPNPNLPGDLNGDNTVGITDLSILLSNYNTTNPTADINLDGTVNILDLSILLSHWGQSYVPPTTAINVLTQYGTSDSAIRAAITAAKSQGKSLYFPAATYNYSSTLMLNGLKAYGDGDTSVLTAATKSSMAIIMSGTAPELRSLKITCPSCELPSGPPTSARLSTGESAGVFIQPGTTGFTVDHVTIDRAGSAGVLNWGGSYGTITNNKVLNTLADAYHNTNGANNMEVAYNSAINVGDDMYAVVSYLTDGKKCHDIKVHDNNGNGQPWGRGISVVGGYNVQIYNNNISRTYGAGIYLTGESAEYPADSLQVNNNTIRYPDQGNIHNANILIWGFDTNHLVSNVTGSGNNLDRLKQGVIYSGSYSSANIGWTYGN